jgi:hypothetical protein
MFPFASTFPTGSITSPLDDRQSGEAGLLMAMILELPRFFISWSCVCSGINWDWAHVSYNLNACSLLLKP